MIGSFNLSAMCLHLVEQWLKRVYLKAGLQTECLCLRAVVVVVHLFYLIFPESKTDLTLQRVPVCMSHGFTD